MGAKIQQLIQKKHVAMDQVDLIGLGPAPAASQAAIVYGVRGLGRVAGVLMAHQHIVPLCCQSFHFRKDNANDWFG
jgi:hypothetical protein